MPETVAAVVVTYNRKELLLECLEALLKQTRPVDAIILVDNASTDGTPEALSEKGYLGHPKIKYLRLPENTGGAGGFHEGVKRGYELGYDWLWLMDDDAEPYLDSLFLLEPFFERPEIVALANAVVKPNGDVILHARGMITPSIFPQVQNEIDIDDYSKAEIEVQLISFVGFLVCKNAIRQIGFPEKKFFIHYDDVEYCFRLTKIGKLLLIPESKIIHKEASSIHSNIRTQRIRYENFWLSYFGKRNLISLGRQHSTNKLAFYFEVFRLTIKNIAGILFYDDHKYRRIKFTICSVCDGLTNRFDNQRPKNILYN